jgi:23S rRNA pseudouridine955/2504/2580 synthase/23S rRNA pseudouridine1911/1915/1917 synthase
MRHTVRREHSGSALAAFLATRFPYHCLAEWAALADGGAVLVNGAPARPDLELGENDVVLYSPDGAAEPAVDRAVSVLYEDRDIMVVAKSGNLPAHPAGRYFRNTLWGVLREDLGVEEPSIINRLDRETSGVTLVARHSAAARACRRQFDDRSVTKTYLAVAEGDFAAPARARGYMGPCPGSAIRKKRRFEPSAADGPGPGREAQWADTEFFPEERRGALTLVRAVPRTGRLHQIRATLLALGRPVAGDKLYGLDEGVFLRFVEDRLTRSDAALMRLGRQALHAAELSFLHPADGRPMTVAAPLPADLRGLLG